jgi:predicted RNA methylase
MGRRKPPRERDQPIRTTNEGSPSDRALRRTLSTRDVTDDQFDRLFPSAIQEISGSFWTPVAVAMRAADLFVEQGVRRVLDVGSGPGKFCLAAAAVAPALALTGIEQRRSLVEAANGAAHRLQLVNVQFHEGNVLKAEWAAFDGFYFFNPFGENIFVDEDHFDETVELSHGRFLAEVFFVERVLIAARLGTTVISYHGFGGRMPRCYSLQKEERAGTGLLRVWRKTKPAHASDGYWIELREGGMRASGLFDRHVGVGSE